MGVGVYFSSRENRRPGEEHGSAKWGTVSSVVKKYIDPDKTQNLILTQKMRLGLNAKKHRRNLNVLVESGLIIKISSDADSEHYDGNISNHYHLMCEDCHHIFDVDVPYLDNIEDEARKNSCHTIKKHNLVFTGLCEECAKKEAI